MWPFSKRKKALTHLLQEDASDAIKLVTQKWLIFQQLKFEEDVTLATQIQLFMEPALEGIVASKPSVGLMPTEMVLMIFATGIMEAQTHAALEVQDALDIPRGEH